MSRAEAGTEAKDVKDAEGAWGPTGRVAAAVAGVAAVAAGGYLVFLLFATEVMASPAAWGLPLFAVVAAVATFFSPCSFPLLPGYVTYTLDRSGTGGPPGPRASLAPSAGVLTFTLLLGGIVAAAGAAAGKALSISSGDPSAVTLALRSAVGLGLVALGALPLAGVTLRTGLLRGRSRTVAIGEERGAPRDLFLYGFGYNAAALGCAGPILAGLILFAVAVGGALGALAAFALYSAVMAALMFAVTRLAVRHREGTLERLTGAAPRIKRAAGAVQVAVGAFVLATVLWPAWFAGTFFPG